MSRWLALCTVALAVVAAVVPAASAETSQPFAAHFKEEFTKKSGPAPGSGSVLGYGKGTESFAPIDDSGYNPVTSCVDWSTGATTIALADGSSFRIIETSRICFPGSSEFAPHSPRSWGNPEKFAGSWVLDTTYTPTGVFADLCGGSGTQSGVFAGGALQVRYDGTLTFC